MNKKLPLFLFTCLGFLFTSCQQEKDVKVIMDAPEGFTGSVSIVSSGTNEILAELSTEDSGELVIPLQETTTGSVRWPDRDEKYLVTLFPGKRLKIDIKADSSITSNSKGDSLLNYLWISNGEFIRKNQELFFGPLEPDSVHAIFSRFRETRDSLIDSKELDQVESDLLKFQNKARINSFLFYFGRIINDLPPEHAFFDFARTIDPNSTGFKSLSNNVLYKYELDYLKAHGNIRSIASFNDFIEESTTDTDLADFLKAQYLSGLLLSPTYWERHASLFNSEVLREEMEQEKDNEYNYLFDRASGRFFSAMEGEPGFDFTAEQADGSKLQLSDLSGKVVFIDSWATWCLSCIAHRPTVLKMAGKYKDNPNVQVLMISVDENAEAWRRFLETRDFGVNHGLDLHIEGGFDSEYRRRYNVNFIPKYILIGRDGRIIKADITEPSLRVEQMIEEALK